MKVLSSSVRKSLLATTATAALLASGASNAQACGGARPAAGAAAAASVSSSSSNCNAIPHPAGRVACVAAIAATASIVGYSVTQACMSSC